MPNCACGCKTPLKPSKRGNRDRKRGEYAKFVSGHQSRVAPAEGKRGWHDAWWYERRAEA